MPARSNAFRDVFNLRGLSPLAVWVPHARAEVAGIQLHWSCGWLHFRLPALALNIPPRIALARYLFRLGVASVDQFRVGADRRVSPWFWETVASNPNLFANHQRHRKGVSSGVVCPAQAGNHLSPRVAFSCAR